MKYPLGFIFTVVLLFYGFWSPARAQVIHPTNATHFRGNVELASVNLPPNFPDFGSTFFMSFWYNSDGQRPYSGEQLLVGTDTKRNLVEVGFVGGPKPYLEVDGVDNLGNCFHFSTGTDSSLPTTTDIPFDGNWHHVILEVWVIPDGSQLLDAQIALDGNIREMEGVPTSQFPGYTFSVWDWQSMTNGGAWFIGAGYFGDLAEFYVDLSGNVTKSALSSTDIANFRDPATGKAVGQGIDYASNGTSPGTQACNKFYDIPTICLRGQPCNFVFGPLLQLGGQLQFLYTFMPVPLNQFNVSGNVILFPIVLSNTRTDPCLNVNRDFPGQFCSEINKPF